LKLNREQFKKSYERAKYQLELEGFVMTEEDEEDVRKVAMGEMSRKELIERLKKGE
jgi:hypothetical protein